MMQILKKMNYFIMKKTFNQNCNNLIMATLLLDAKLNNAGNKKMLTH